MRSLERVFIRTRSRNESWPKELLFKSLHGFCFVGRPYFKYTGGCAVYFVPLWGLWKLRFWLQSDNTVKEIRNMYSCRMFSAMTQAGVWSTSSVNHLEVGHTHEDVDGVLSLCKAALDSCPVIHTPHDVANRLRAKLLPVFQARDCELQVEVVGAVACSWFVSVHHLLKRKLYIKTQKYNIPFKIVKISHRLE